MNAFIRTIIAVAAMLPAAVMAADLAAMLYKNPSCGCCTAYAEYLEENGFKVDVIESNDLPMIRQEHGVAAGLQSCHTMLIGDYVVEGHVPVESVQRLLAEQPAIRGITAPGMPAQSPGMSPQGPWSLTVYTLTDDGQQVVYERY